MKSPALEKAFRVQAHAFPGGAWHGFVTWFKADRTSRSTQEHPIWRRVIGRGYQIWISDVALIDSLARPPIWEIKVEALAPLNEEGLAQWEEIVSGIRQLFEELGLDYTVT